MTFVAGAALLTALVVGASRYLVRELHRQAGVAWSATGLPQSMAPEVARLIVIDEMLDVTSIALGRSQWSTGGLVTSDENWDKAQFDGVERAAR